MTPLTSHLKGVRSLYVVGVNQMAGIPVDLLSTEFTISNVPSGTFFARQSTGSAPRTGGLLALGDPVFARPRPDPSASQEGETPPEGVLIRLVEAKGAADRAGLKARDVIVRYGDTPVATSAALDQAIQDHSQANEVTLTVWRPGDRETFRRSVPSGPLGARYAREPVGEALVALREGDALQRRLRGDTWDDLPASRVEVSELARLFGPESTTLLDSAASEQSLEDLRQRGDLAQYRYLHFATHGQANNVRTMESLLVLANDALPADDVPRAGQPQLDGRLLASEVLEHWDLNAELVTLSACETALGRSGGGDGLLGFAQAFLAAGSRAVCLSLWEVDDDATSLLMTRFYQNLLGKRPGLSSPLPKAQALAEAKHWLRTLPTEQADRLIARATNSVSRGDRGKGADLHPQAPADSPLPKAAASGHRFSDPRYWSAFILIGDPN